MTIAVPMLESCMCKDIFGIDSTGDTNESVVSWLITEHDTFTHYAERFDACLRKCKTVLGQGMARVQRTRVNMTVCAEIPWCARAGGRVTGEAALLVVHSCKGHLCGVCNDIL